MNGMLTLRVFIQMLTLNETGREHCVLHRTSSEFRIILQLRTHAERSCSVKMCIRLEISSEISDKGWQWSSSQRCRSSWGSEIESAGLCYYKSSQHFPLYKTGVLFVRHESIPSTLLGNHEASAGIFYLVWAPHFRKNVSQLEEFWTLSRKEFREWWGMWKTWHVRTCEEIGSVCPKKVKIWTGTWK